MSARAARTRLRNRNAGKKENGQRNLAILVGLRGDGSEVERHEISLEAYYEDLHEMLDAGAYRRERGIVTVEGQLISSSGDRLQEFRNRYSDDGSYRGGRAIHADGTVTEDGEWG